MTTYPQTQPEAALDADARTITSILVPWDDSACAADALDVAVWLARFHGAEIHLLHVLNRMDEMPHTGIDALDLATWQECREGDLRRALDAREGRGLPHTTTVQLSLAVADVIVQEAEAHAADLLVIGTHGRRGLAHYMLGSVAEEVIRRAPCDVLTVRAGVVPRHRANDTFQHLLVPVDFSEFSEGLVRRARRLAAQHGARLHLLNVIEPLPLPVSISGVLTLQDLVPDVRGQARKQLEQYLRMEGPDVPGTVHVEEGRATATIRRVADDVQADLIMLATHGLSALERFFIGSVTERVVRSAPCPVWVARDTNPQPS